MDPMGKKNRGKRLGASFDSITEANMKSCNIFLKKVFCFMYCMVVFACDVSDLGLTVGIGNSSWQEEH